MKKMLFSLLLLTVFGALQAQTPADGGAQREWLTSFTAVEVTAPLDIRFIRVPDSEAPKIIYDTKGSYTTRFRFEVRDKVLRIMERPDSRRPERTQVEVYYNSLERIAVADAVATFDSTLVSTVLDLTIGGMAQVTVPLDVKDLQLEQTGKSRATLTGSARYLSLFVSAGTLDASALEVMSAEVNVTGSGSASLWVTDRFEGKTSTGGKITYKGTPTVIRGGMKFMGGDITRTGE
ncbi:head GIN domain-containing protein [uncultured Alistipes sp.]|uniref:head GIN domain-containing protein n=1 Tax=uncultured Alistipes sp. TaxID=538949 RepID=UPI00320B9E5A